MLASMPFSVDGRLIAKLKNGYYCKLDLPAGDHTFTRPLWEGGEGLRSMLSGFTWLPDRLCIFAISRPRCGLFLRSQMIKKMPVTA
jgi:hypothetical protein